MPDESAAKLKLEIQQQDNRVRGLRMAVYTQADPSADPELYRHLAQEENRLRELEQQLKVAPPTAEVGQPADLAPRGRFLGPRTTGLKVEPTLHMQPIPTGIYHLLDPETDPLLTVAVSNESRETRRVCIKSFLEGLSAQAVRTVEVEPRQSISVNMLPTLFPERARVISEIQRATLHVVAEDFDGKPESHDTFPVVCLARTSSFNAVSRPESGQPVDLSHYYGAWVTPYAESVQARIRRAADLLPSRKVWGYQGRPESVDQQVGALYASLHEAEVVYINSTIDYGSPAGYSTQRTRLPRESLANRSANCIDGTVLMASLLEGASLNPAIVLVPGHAFVGWERWEGTDEWSFLETTMIGTAGIDDALKSGQRQYNESLKFSPDHLKLHRLAELRARGIWPME